PTLTCFLHNSGDVSWQKGLIFSGNTTSKTLTGAPYFFCHPRRTSTHRCWPCTTLNVVVNCSLSLFSLSLNVNIVCVCVCVCLVPVSFVYLIFITFICFMHVYVCVCVCVCVLHTHNVYIYISSTHPHPHAYIPCMHVTEALKYKS